MTLLRRWRTRRGPQIGFLLVIWIVLGRAFAGRWTFALDRSSVTPFQTWVGSGMDSIDSSRNSNPVMMYVVENIRGFINNFVTLLQTLLSQAPAGHQFPLIGWVGVIAIVGWIVYATANWRVALLAVVGFYALGSLGFWTESMDTLALVIASVVLALILGVPLGILAGIFPRFEKVLTPFLDFAQVMPTFVYLMPVALFFLIGPASATIVTLIYAIPPAIRISAIAVRGVPTVTVEAGTSLGTTRWQLLRKVQLPLAKRTMVVGVNQTIMAALSMVTIAALIDAPGLGQVVVGALQKLDVGTSFQAGLAIVIMAIVLDRSTTAAAAKVRRETNTGAHPHRRRRLGLSIGFVGVIAAVLLSYFVVFAADFQGADIIGQPFSDVMQSASDWAQLHLAGFTSAYTDWVSNWFLNPLQSALVGTPWFLTAALVLAVAAIFGGLRLTLIAAGLLAVLVGTGLWSDAMVTLAATFFAAAITVVLGVVLGAWMGRNRRVDSLLRPVLDAGQVLPAFVYLVPFLGLFGATRFTAMLAAVVYAAPASVKLIADGVRGVPETIREAAQSAGASTWQLITKVELPMARQSIALATNQGLIYVLAMVVVGGLVGAGGLGYLVVAGFAQSSLRGKGMAAGLAIVVMGILIDRITQAASRPRQRAAIGADH